MNCTSTSPSNSSGYIQRRARRAAAHGVGIGNPSGAEWHLVSCVSQLSRRVQDRSTSAASAGGLGGDLGKVQAVRLGEKAPLHDKLAPKGVNKHQ